MERGTSDIQASKMKYITMLLGLLLLSVAFVDVKALDVDEEDSDDDDIPDEEDDDDDNDGIPDDGEFISFKCYKKNIVYVSLLGLFKLRWEPY